MTEEQSRRGGPARAFWLETAGFAACEIGALVGYDIVVLDMEHGVIAPDAADVLIAHAGRLGLRVYSRVAAPERVPIQQALDSGADGVILPQIAGAAHARPVAAFAKYPPLGSRGIGFSRAMDYGGVGAGFTGAENARTRCYAMIETPEALESCAEIAALEAVDGLFVGPGDLSLTRGRGLYQGADADEDMEDRDMESRST
jgi:2-dehydro-3-deoxyglucarate aldolase/4-hydroxy-2-oxoheptanedioate aldolase